MEEAIPTYARSVLGEAVGEIKGQGVVVQWLVFHQFATAFGVSIGTSLILFVGVRGFLVGYPMKKKEPEKETKKSYLEFIKNLGSG